MSDANRIPLRRQWREDHPRLTQAAAASAGKPSTSRRSFGLYKIEMLQPAKYARMVKRALGKVGAKTDDSGDVIVNEQQLGAIADAVGA